MLKFYEFENFVFEFQNKLHIIVVNESCVFSVNTFKCNHKVIRFNKIMSWNFENFPTQ